MIRLSIIIPTYNRKTLLLTVFESLRQLRHQPGELEVVVVDDGSSDGTVAALEARRDPFPVIVIRHEKSLGPAIARNRGAEAARGDVLGFLDSDIIVGSDWWCAAEPYFQDEHIAGVEGLTAPSKLTAPPTPFTHIVSNVKGGNYLTCNMLYRKNGFSTGRGV